MNKASRGDGTSAELFQILKDGAIQVLHLIFQQVWKTQHWPQDWKRSVFNTISKKGNAKECSDYCTIAFISHASKVMLKILQSRLQLYMNWELPYVQAGFRKGRGTKGQIANICWITEKGREFQKNIYFFFIDYAKTFDCMDHKKLWKILQEMGIPDHRTCLLWNLYAGQEATLRNGHGTMGWFQIGKGKCQGPAYLTDIWVHHAKCCAGWSTSWNEDCRGKYQPQICIWHHPMEESKEELEPLDESESGKWKSWLKTQH